MNQKVLTTVPGLETLRMCSAHNPRKRRKVFGLASRTRVSRRHLEYSQAAMLANRGKREASYLIKEKVSGEKRKKTWLICLPLLGRESSRWNCRRTATINMTNQRLREMKPAKSYLSGFENFPCSIESRHFKISENESGLQAGSDFTSLLLQKTEHSIVRVLMY